MLKTKHIGLLSLMSIMAFTACDRDPIETKVSLEADRLEVTVGQPVKFTVKSNANYLSIYPGEFESNYFRSAHFLLKGKTNQQLQDEVYREPNPNVDVFKSLVNDTAEGAPSIVDKDGNKQIECRINWNYSDFGTEDNSSNDNPNNTTNGEYAKVVHDATIDKTVLEINVKNGYGWKSGPKINMRAKLGTKRFLTLRMRHSIDSVMNRTTLKYEKNKTTYRISMFANGWKEGASAASDLVLNAEQQYDIAPTLAYQDVVLDLTPLIVKWEDKQGGKMVKLEAVQIVLGAVDNTGYYGQYFIESAGFGTVDYYPFATGEALPVLNGSGVNVYTHTYKTPGEYDVVVVANSVGFKNYTGNGYNDNKGDAISANEYGYNTKTAKVKIVVKP